VSYETVADVQTNSGCARATTNGFVDELWTLDRIALLIQRLTGISHHPAHVWALLRHRLGWTMRCPVRRATKRDQAMVDQWVAERRPRIKQTVSVWACGPGGSLSGSDAGIAA
jgi:transposase